MLRSASPVRDLLLRRGGLALGALSLSTAAACSSASAPVAPEPPSPSSSLSESDPTPTPSIEPTPPTSSGPVLVSPGRFAGEVEPGCERLTFETEQDDFCVRVLGDERGPLVALEVRTTNREDVEASAYVSFAFADGDAEAVLAPDLESFVGAHADGESPILSLTRRVNCDVAADGPITDISADVVYGPVGQPEQEVIVALEATDLAAVCSTPVPSGEPNALTVRTRRTGPAFEL